MRMSDSCPRDEVLAIAKHSFEDVQLSHERRSFLAPKLQALLNELVKFRELEPSDGEPAIPRPWEETGDVR